jgi:hypothetical protein
VASPRCSCAALSDLLLTQVAADGNDVEAGYIVITQPYLEKDKLSRLCYLAVIYVELYGEDALEQAKTRPGHDTNMARCQPKHDVYFPSASPYFEV